METGLSMTQGEGAARGTLLFPLWASDFISLISQFVNDIFKSSVGSKIVSTISFFLLKFLILLVFETAIVIVL